MLIATDATGTPTSPDSIATILPSDLPAVTTGTSGVNAIAATVQTALTNNYLRKTSGNILNADINASAGIVYSKLSLGTSIRNSDVLATAGIVTSKLAAQPYCLALRGLGAGSQSFGSATGQITFTSAVDNGSMWSGANPTRVTVPSAGWYRVVVSAYCTLANPSAADKWLLQKNGVTVVGSGLGNATSLSYGGEVGVLQLVASDYLELWFFRSTGTAITTLQPYTVIGGNQGTQPLSPNANPDHFGALLVQFIGA